MGKYQIMKNWSYEKNLKLWNFQVTKLFKIRIVETETLFITSWFDAFTKRFGQYGSPIGLLCKRKLEIMKNISYEIMKKDVFCRKILELWKIVELRSFPAYEKPDVLPNHKWSRFLKSDEIPNTCPVRPRYFPKKPSTRPVMSQTRAECLGHDHRF